jgi:hypothetical protein
MGGASDRCRTGSTRLEDVDQLPDDLDTFQQSLSDLCDQVAYADRPPDESGSARVGRRANSTNSLVVSPVAELLRRWRTEGLAASSQRTRNSQYPPPPFPHPTIASNKTRLRMSIGTQTRRCTNPPLLCFPSYGSAGPAVLLARSRSGSAGRLPARPARPRPTPSKSDRTQGPRLHGSCERHADARPLWAHVPRQRRGGGRTARRLP